MSYTNFVQLRLALAATSGQTTLTVMVPTAPFVLPAANGTITLLDAPSAPPKAEIVSYTTVTVNGDGTATLGGVVRGCEGTAAQAWSAGATLTQSLTAAGYAADLAAKQDLIAPGTAAQFWRGDKTWADLGNAICATALTGLSMASKAAIVASDTVLAALGKLQAQVNDKAPLTGAGASGSWGISVTGNSGTATTLAGNETDWATRRTSAVANMLGWKKHGNGHVIFDASAGTAPNGAAKNNANPDSDWVAGHPTLMGWNGANTAGVRVARAAQAEKCVDTGWILLSLYNDFFHTGSALHIRRVGNIVYLQGHIARWAPPGGLTAFATIPAGFRPTKNGSFPAVMTADNFNWVLADIGVQSANGVLGLGLVGVPSQYNANWAINTCWVTDYA